MCRNTFTVAATFLILCAPSRSAFSQDANSTPPGADQPYTLNVAVNEVKVTFHVADSKGDPVEHLKKSDVQLTDNGKPQGRFVAFHEYSDLPIRVGFLIDNSPSMNDQLQRTQAIATELATQFFRPNSDRAFVMGFGIDNRVTQDWTGDSNAVSQGITAALSRESYEREGTAMFDAVYKACRDNFPGEAAALSGNFILLFTDGEDNSSHVWEAEAVDMCQRARTAIYVFDPEWKARASRGQQILEDLVSQTGGRVFYESKLSVHDALAETVSDMRYQYELIYSPPALKRDGSFHKIKIRCTRPHSQIQSRSGYYAYGKR